MIRDANDGDVPLLAGIEARAARRFGEAGLPAAEALPLHDPVELLIAAMEKRVLVAVDGDDVAVGFALLEAHSDGDAHLLELDVEPAHCGKGLGRALLAASADWARSRGLQRLTLTTFRDIPFNAPFYTRVGFRALALEALGSRLRSILEQEVLHGVAVAPRVAMAMPLT